MIYTNIIQTIGNTPVVKLNNLVDKDYAEIYLKLEMFNPGASVKDRIAFNMIEDAEKSGLIKPGDVLIEPTSGNTGIGLALIAASKGYRLILTMPESATLERRKLLQAYGAEIVLTDGSNGMRGAINKAVELAETYNYYMLQQFKNLANPYIHRTLTAKEILNDFNNDLDVFVSGVGTGGTITGVGEILKQNIKSIKVIAVEPSSSAVLSGEEAGLHKIQGIGAGFVPEVLNMEIIDEIIKVTDEDAAKTSRELAKKEGILAGISSGAAVWAAISVAKKLGKGKKILTVAPDTGERYLSTPLFDKD